MLALLTVQKLANSAWITICCKGGAVWRTVGQSDLYAMLASVQPCFQLLRIGSPCNESVQDLYTFRPALSNSVFRLGRAAELCDITLDSASVSRIHAELHAEKETNVDDMDQPDEGWRVHIRDRSTHGETKAYIINIWIDTRLKVKATSRTVLSSEQISVESLYTVYWVSTKTCNIPFYPLCFKAPGSTRSGYSLMSSGNSQMVTRWLLGASQLPEAQNSTFFFKKWEFAH